jgi:CRP-like cAMP-binding protein
MVQAIDSFLAHEVWHQTRRDRLIPLAEAAGLSQHPAGDVLFNQFHPADQFSLLWDGIVGHETRAGDDGDSWLMGQVDWRWAAIGWSGFLRPFRNGTTARTLTDSTLLTWRHDALATLFYADPALAVAFFRIVLHSASLQFDALRAARVAAAGTLPSLTIDAPVPVPPSPTTDTAARHRFAPDILTALRRSAFFELFDDETLVHLSTQARLQRRERGQVLVHQGDDTAGLWVLADGHAVAGFANGEGVHGALVRFRTIPEHGGIAAGIPGMQQNWKAEATVVAASTCWFYHLPCEVLDTCMSEDPEFGRAFMQRQLVRLAHLVSAARLPRYRSDEEPEIAAVKSLLDHVQTRIPVTSALHRVPYLLSHRLTTGTAFDCLDAVRRDGHYEERATARACSDLLTGLRAEQRFYQALLSTYEAVTGAPADTPASTLRERCDEGMAGAFRYLRTEIHGLGRLPDKTGNIVIINHLACPEYYQLPNGCHFSFDTAFVSVLLKSCYHASPIRVVRQSPGAEYGHNLFYTRLGHITVPTVDSGLDAAPQALQRMRRDAAQVLMQQGTEVLARGENVLICPEGRSQMACDSPARFYSGAFRLALAARHEPQIVPIALAGFDRRYKDARLVGVIQPSFRVSDAMRRRGTDDMREFLDAYRAEFAGAVALARQLSNQSSGTGSSPAPQPGIAAHLS